MTKIEQLLPVDKDTFSAYSNIRDDFPVYETNPHIITYGLHGAHTHFSRSNKVFVLWIMSTAAF